MTLERIEEIKNEIADLGIDYFRATANQPLLARYYYEAFGETLCTTCPGDRWIEGFNKILNLNTEKFLIMKNRKFLLKNDSQIHFQETPPTGVPSIVTNGNLTDEMVDKIIAFNPVYESWFVPNPHYMESTQAAESEKKQEPSALEVRAEELESTLSKQELMDELSKRNVEFDSKSNKTVLSQLLAVAESTQAAE